MHATDQFTALRLPAEKDDLKLLWPMFSGKTEELLAAFAEPKSPTSRLNCSSPPPTRYADKEVVSHDNAMPSTVMASSQAFAARQCRSSRGRRVDEAQFFDDGLPDVCNALADRGIRSSSGVGPRLRGAAVGHTPLVGVG